MKKIALPLLSFSLFILLLFFIQGCKKNDRVADTGVHSLEELYREKLKNEPFSFTQVVNLKGKAPYLDSNGNKISFKTPTNPDGQLVSCIQPDNSEYRFEFVSISTGYRCGYGYKFGVKMKVISEFNLVITDMQGMVSNGRLRFRNATGAVIYTTPSLRVESITLNGVVGHNSAGDDLNEFIIEYSTDEVAGYYYNLSASVQPSMVLYTDCQQMSTIFTGSNITPLPVSAASMTTNPCLRTDKIYWNPRSSSNPRPSVAGTNTMFNQCYPPTYIYPDYHEIMYKGADDNWYHFRLFVNFLNMPSRDTIGLKWNQIFYIDVPNCPNLTPGFVQVMYRNIMGTPQNHTCESAWVYETWYLN